MRHVLGTAALAMLACAACARGASAVTTPASTPPAAQLTPADLQARMKTIQGTAGAVRMKLADHMLADAAKDAQQLATAFGDVERFWAQRNRQDAMTWSQQARAYAAQIAGAAAANDAATATKAADNLASTCAQCHAAYREGTPQAGYRIKAGAL